MLEQTHIYQWDWCVFSSELTNPRLCLCCYTRLTSVIQPKTGICTIAGLRHCWRSFSDRFDAFLFFRHVQRVFAFVCMCEKSKAQQEKSHHLLCILILSLFLFSSDCPFIQSHVNLRQDYHRPQKRERVEKRVIRACLHLNINL